MSLSYQLRKWSRLVRLREGGRCALCTGQFDIWTRLSAHHIRPKALYLDLALELDNGIALCSGCHIHITHGGNTFADIKAGEGGRWRFLLPTFEGYILGERVSQFNEENQGRLQPPR